MTSSIAVRSQNAMLQSYTPEQRANRRDILSLASSGVSYKDSAKQQVANNEAMMVPTPVPITEMMSKWLY